MWKHELLLLKIKLFFPLLAAVSPTALIGQPVWIFYSNSSSLNFRDGVLASLSCNLLRLQTDIVVPRILYRNFNVRNANLGITSLSSHGLAPLHRYQLILKQKQIIRCEIRLFFANLPPWTTRAPRASFSKIRLSRTWSPYTKTVA